MSCFDLDLVSDLAVAILTVEILSVLCLENQGVQVDT